MMASDDEQVELPLTQFVILRWDWQLNSLDDEEEPVPEEHWEQVENRRICFQC
jgi:hypothetical protein